MLANYANIESFYELKEKEKVVYLGIDCTAESLHIGHLFLFIQSLRFVKEGFKVIFLLGGVTSKIGDPSDKEKERKKIKVNELVDYQKKIKKQLWNLLFKKVKFPFFSPLELFFDSFLLKKIYQVLNINEEEKVESKWKKYFSYVFPSFLNQEELFIIENNETWFKKLNCLDFIDLIGRNISLNYLLSKDWVKKRIKTGLSFLAFSYSLFQAYDFFVLNKKYGCRGQLGGSDQWGNMTTGLKLLRSLVPENNFFALNFSLLIDKHGKKLSKSEKKGVLFLNSDYWTFFDFFRNLSDKCAEDFILKFTFLSREQIEKLKKINNPPSLRILQRILLELLWLLNYKKISEVRKILEENKARS